MKVLVLAPTGKSAHNSQGAAPHSILRFLIHLVHFGDEHIPYSNLPLGEFKIQKLDNILPNIEILILEECSLFGTCLIGDTEYRFRKIK